MRTSPLVVALLLVLSFGGLARAEPVSGASETRIALVVGNAAYGAGALATPANDAGLVAQALQAAGFDVVGARDLDEESLRRALRDFTDKAAASGPDTVAFVYLAGYGLQLNGENYFAPVDARIATAADVPVRALRLSDYARRLAALPLKARFVVLDGGRTTPFARSGDPLAGGLALTEAEPGSLIAFNAAPGTVGPPETGPYGAYAQALVEMIREGGLAPAELFDRVRLRVSETTQGGEVPWSASRIDVPFVFFTRAADAPAVADPGKVAALAARPLREIDPQDAYAACLHRDTLAGYEDFVSAYPQDPLAKRVRVLIAVRREALTWRRTDLVDTPDAYWSYLSRYPRGPHAWDARRRLRERAAAPEPPHFAMLAYDVPPPPPEELVYVERPAVYLADPVYDLAPPPPPPVFFLPPRPAYIVDLGPPPPVTVAYVLPAPAFVPMPAYVVAPAFVAPPPNNVYFENIHNTTVIETLNRQTVDLGRERHGASSAPAIGAGAGAAAGLAVSRVALPPALQQRGALPANVPPGGPAGDPRRQQGNFGPPGPAPGSRPGFQPLPGQNGQPLPQQANRPGPPGPALQAPLPGHRPSPSQPGLAAPNAPPPSPQPMQATRPGPMNPALAPDARRAIGQPRPDPAPPVRQAVRPGRSPVRAGPDASQQPVIRQRQALPPRQAPQAAERRAAPSPQAAQQREIQRQAAQERAAQQRQMQAAQQAVQRQQQAAQQRQMMQQQRAAAQQQRQMQAQQEAARRQQVARPQPQPHGGGRPSCPPGAHCR